MPFGIRRKRRIGGLDTPDDYQNIAPYVAISGASMDHGTLIGLGDDDHPQYAAIAQAETITNFWTFQTDLQIEANIDFDTSARQITGGGDLTIISAGDLILNTSGGDLRAITDLQMEANLDFDSSARSITAGAALSITPTTTLTLDPTNNLILSPGGDITLDPTGNDVLPQTNYDINLGAINKKYLTLHAAELWVQTLVAQEVLATIGGRVLVGPTTVLTADLGSGDAYMELKHNQPDGGDVLLLEGEGKVEFIRIGNHNIAGVNTGDETFSIAGDSTALYPAGKLFQVRGSTGNDGQWTVDSSVYSAPNTVITVTGDITDATIDGYIAYRMDVAAGPYTYYAWKRNHDGTGANDWNAGDAVFNTGSNIYDGFIDLYSVSGVVSGSGPTIVGNIRTGTAYNNIEEHWALGNLNGLYGYGVDTYGVALGRDGYGHMTLDDTNGLIIYDGAGNDVITMAPTGDAEITGTLTAGGGEVILDTDGISIESGNATPNYIEWIGQTAGLGSYIYSTHLGSAQNAGWHVYGTSAGDDSMSITFEVTAGSKHASVVLMADEGTHEYVYAEPALVVNQTGAPTSGVEFQVNGDASISGGLRIGDTTAPTYGDLRVAADVALSGGLAVGNVDSDPANGYAYINNGLRVGDFGSAVNDAIVVTNHLFVNDTANTFQVIGVTINQGAQDNEILSLKASEVAHGMSAITETDTYCTFAKETNSLGGCRIDGYTESQNALRLQGNHTLDGTVKSATAAGSVEIIARKKSGTSVGNIGTNANILGVGYSPTNMVFFVDKEGNVYADATTGSGNIGTFDQYNDVALTRAVTLTTDRPGLIKSEYDKWIEYNADDLERLGLIGPMDQGYRLVNITGMQRLHSGAIWQLYQKIEEQQQQITDLTRRLLN